MISYALYVVSNIALPFRASIKEALSVASRQLNSAGILHSPLDLYVYRRSIDARNKSDIKFVYSIALRSPEVPPAHEKLAKLGITRVEYSSPVFEVGEKKATAPIVVVGSGPAGLFASLILAEAGFKVRLIERGGCVDERKSAVEFFKKTRILDPNTNIQFGAGGAGTFSDGKLVTRINDPMCSYVLERFVEFGAPEEILYLAKPHIGTDILSSVVDNILKRIEELGSSVHYHTTMLDFKDTCGTIKNVVTDKGEIECSAVILAIGHSARDTYKCLLDHSMDISSKDFSVGMRIEHKRRMIDEALYGDNAQDPLLPSGEYNLSHNTKVRGVYTFCMCPGGEVVAATSETDGVVVNGMSEHARSGENSNCAVCCSVFRADYGSTPESAIEFQRKIERAAFHSAGKNYNAPIITVGDFLRGECKRDPYDVIPTYMNGSGVTLTSPERYLPSFVTEAIKGALLSFDKKIQGFASFGSVLTGPETRTSSPIRIQRSQDTRLATGYNNLFPSGEGAGYAGGISSAAIDGVKCALALMKIYRP